MADDNELKIKVSIDKVALENVKSENRKLVAQIKADAQKSVKELETISKLELQQSKNINSQILTDKKLNYQREKDAFKQLQTEKRNLEKQASEQSKRDAEMVRRVQERQLNQSLGSKSKKGNGLMYWSELGENLTVVAAGIGMAFSKVQQFIGGAIEKSIQFEKSIQTLKFATDSITFKGLTDFNKEFQTKSVFSGKDIVNAEMFLSAQGRTEEQIKKTIQAAMDLSVVTGDDLDGAVRKLDMTYEGSIGRMGRLDDRVKGLTQAELENGAAVDLIGEKYRGFADKQANTMAGKIAILEKNFSSLEKSLGDSIIKEVGKWFDTTNKSADELAGTFKNLKTGIDWVIEGFGTILRTVPNLYSVIKGVISGFSALGDVWRFITDDSYKFVNAMKDVVNKLSDILIVGRAIKGLYNLFNGEEQDAGSPIGFMKTAIDLSKSFTKKAKENIYDYGSTDATAPKLPEKKTGTSNRGSNSDKVIEEKAILNAYQQQEEVINKIKEALILNVGLVGEEIRLKKELLEAEYKLYEIKFGSIKAIENRNIGNALGNYLPMQEDIRGGYQQTQNPFIQSKDFDVVMQQMIEPLNGVFGDVFGKVKDTFSNISDLFGLKADSFIGKMISGFDTVLQIINLIVSTLETVNAVKGILSTITSFIPGGNIIGGLSGGGDMAMPMPGGGGSSLSVNMPDVKLSGSDIYLSWRRQDRKESGRLE